MTLKHTMLAALRGARQRWLSRAETWRHGDLDDRQRREFGLPPRRPRPGDARFPDWF